MGVPDSESKLGPQISRRDFLRISALGGLRVLIPDLFHQNEFSYLPFHIEPISIYAPVLNTLAVTNGMLLTADLRSDNASVLKIVQFSNPQYSDCIAFTENLQLKGNIKNIAAAGNRVYVTQTDFTGNKGYVSEVYLSDTFHPEILKTCQLRSTIRGFHPPLPYKIALSAGCNYAYVTTSSTVTAIGDLMVLDLQKDQLEEVGRLTLPVGWSDIIVQENMLFGTDYAGQVVAVDVTSASNPRPIGIQSVPDIARSVVSAADRLYTINDNGEMSVLDPNPNAFNLPSQKEIEQAWETARRESGKDKKEGFCHNNYFYDNKRKIISAYDFLWAANGPEGFQIYDISDPDHPNLALSFPAKFCFSSWTLANAECNFFVASSVLGLHEGRVDIFHLSRKFPSPYGSSIT